MKIVIDLDVYLPSMLPTGAEVAELVRAQVCIKGAEIKKVEVSL